MKTKVSFWLIPSEEDRAYFQGLINTLAQKYDAPTFTPHVTIYSGEYAPEESPTALIEKATQGVQGFSLRVDKLLYTDEYTKTFFVQFNPSLSLSQISETLRNSSQKPSDFALNPHLSLIYKHLSEVIKQGLMTNLSLPRSEIFFDDGNNPETEYLRTMFWEALNNALGELPAEQRDAFVLNEMEGIPFKILAEQTGETINTLLSRKRYAVLHLRKRLAVLRNELLNY